ncbi:hypothetical protein GY514_004991, partial [Escherichia coli]|nr:hypothetical protein [Escherichia coli]
MRYIYLFISFFVFLTSPAVSRTFDEVIGNIGPTTMLARSDGHRLCGSTYMTCSGDIFYCATSYDRDSVQSFPGMHMLVVRGTWLAFKSYKLDESGSQVYSQCKDTYLGSFLPSSFNETPSDKVCQSRPVLDGMTFSDVYKGDDGTRYVNVQGCIYEATGNPLICNPDDDTVCTANWKPVAVDPAFSDDKEDGDTDDNSGGVTG